MSTQPCEFALDLAETCRALPSGAGRTTRFLKIWIAITAIVLVVAGAFGWVPGVEQGRPWLGAGYATIVVAFLVDRSIKRWEL